MIELNSHQDYKCVELTLKQIKLGFYGNSMKDHHF
jgi:hypothetical protein